MRHLLLSISLLLLPLFPAAAQAQVSVSINVDTYPTLVQVPGYPVYYDPQLNSNYFFYDGLYWVYAGDTWYASTWYNGPWQMVGSESVPLFVLRVPVRYYRQPPVYFRGWQADAPPRWGEHWGQGWEAHRAGWDHWDRQAVPPPAPLPVYQRQYAGARYPRAPEQQQAIRAESYHYQPREAVTQQHYQQAPKQQAPKQQAPKPADSEAAARPPPGHTPAPPPQQGADVHPPAPQHPQAPPPPQRAEVRPPAPASTPQHAAPPPPQRAEVRPPTSASAPPHAATPPHQQAAQSPARPPASAPQQHEDKAPPPQKSQEKKGEQHGQESK